MPKSLRGNFLIAAKSLRDPNFYKSVVLIVEHGDTGAMGLVINRPSEISLSRALKKHFDLPETGDLIYVGGPVEENGMFILHNAQEWSESESPIVSGIFVGNSAEVFENIVQQSAEAESEIKFRVYSGCSGWSPGQLESELSRNDWWTCPAEPELVFHADPYRVWDLALEQFRRNNPLVPGADIEGNAELN